MSIDIEQLIHHSLLPIVLLPICGALYNAFLGRHVHKDVVTAVAVGSVFTSFLFALAGFVYLLVHTADPQHQRITHDVYEWFSISVRGVDVPIHVRFVMDHLSGIMAVMVTGIGALIHVYSIGYMKEDPGYWRFMTYLNLFMASMLILVLASNLPLMFVGWEGVGLCSYLLIGFWFENEDYAKAGRKAFVVNRIGDFGVLIGMFLLVATVAGPNSPEAFDFVTINAAATRLGLDQLSIGSATLGMSIATAASFMIFLGCTGKSAQLPLYVWLPDAMAGPTPVSALIHAATMVTAGVYLCCRLSPVIVESPLAMSVIAIIGALTALIAASIALVQNQMKKILAYSTVSQLGFMFAAVGMGAFAGGFFHVFTHAFFKACLFLGAGSVMHAIHAHGDADIRYLGGLKDKLPKTHITFAIATAAIAGLPLLSGFFSKDEILLGAATWGMTSPTEYAWVGWFVFAVLIIAATMTAFYMFRLYFRTFWGEYKGGHAPGEHHHHEGDDHEHAEDDGHGHPDGYVEPHESPDTMAVPLYVLSAGAALAGFLGLPHLLHLPNWWSSWLAPQGEEFSHAFAASISEGAEHEAALSAGMRAAREVSGSVATLAFEGQMVHAPSLAGILAMALGTVAGLLGFGLAFLWYKQQDGETPRAIMQSTRGFHRFLMEKWYVDELYGYIVVKPMKFLAVLSANIDRYFVDLLLAKATALIARTAGLVLTRTQNGVVYVYAGLFVLGLAGMGWWFTYPHSSLTAEPTVGTIRWTAPRGVGYEYRWDFDSDGTFEEDEWSDNASASHTYEGDAFFGLVGVLETPRDMFGETEIPVTPGGGAEDLPVELLGPDWAREMDPEAVPPSLSYENGEMVVYINGANIPDRDGDEDGVVRLRPGDTLSLGGGRLVVAVLIRGTVQVRNAFHNLSTTTEEVTLRVPRQTGRQAALEPARARVGAARADAAQVQLGQGASR